MALVMGLLATLAGWFFLRENERRLESAYHEAAADRLLQQVNERLGKVDLILRSVAGLFSAQNLVERREFENYVAGLRPIDALPEVVGIGFMRRVETARVGAVEALLSAGFTHEDLDGSWQPYGPKGCERCKGSGYKGRLGIYQVMPISEEIARIIMTNGNSMDIAAQAQREGVRDLRQSGLLKVKQGVTSLTEVLACTNE